jgi:3-methyl-2-oxobutanoate hydroxymethyltransferase
MPSDFSPKKIRTTTLQEFKARGEKFSCLTSYDSLTSSIFDQAGIEFLLVGDSAANNFLGFDSTLPITLDEIVTFTRAVSRGAKRALVVADMPFGSYEISDEEAVRNAVRLMKEGGAEAVKLEGGARSARVIRAIVDAGIPVCAHLGFTPQSVHSLGGFKIQGKGESAKQLVEDAKSVEAAGAFAVVLEMVPAELAAEIDRAIGIPTIGIGAGAGTTGQVLVWTDLVGLSDGPAKKFVKQYLDLRTQISKAASSYREDVRANTFPGKEHSF